MFAFQKTPDGNGESYSSEVFFMCSKNLLSLHNKEIINFKGSNVTNKPEKEFVYETIWETLPLGEQGLQTKTGLWLGEEPHLLQISGSRLLCFWRTDLGFLDSRHSNDNGKTWTSSTDMNPLTFDPIPQVALNDNEIMQSTNFQGKRQESYLGSNGEERKAINNDLIIDRAKYLKSSIYSSAVISNHNILRNPRGAITPIKLSDGYFALLYYNNSYTDKVGYVGRLVYWLTLGNMTKDNKSIFWSQPEIVLWWDGILLDNRENWNEDWAIVDGAGYADFQELPNGNLSFVESNKLTVRYHEIPASVLALMKNQVEKRQTLPKETLNNPIFPIKYQQDMVYNYIKLENVIAPNRAPVLPDLRAGGGFTFCIGLDFNKLYSKDHIEDQTLIKSLSTVSGALDEEEAPDITKGYEIVFTKEDRLRLSITDGFKGSFDFEVDFRSTQEDYYKVKDGSKISMVSFVVDGGPKVVSCIINDRLYNAFPCGWKFLPREFGEIGGSNINVNHSFVDAYIIYDRALLVSECIRLVTSV